MPRPALYLVKLHQHESIPSKVAIEICSHDGRWRSVAVQLTTQRDVYLSLRDTPKDFRCRRLDHETDDPPKIYVQKLAGIFWPVARLITLLVPNRLLPIARKEFAYPSHKPDDKKQRATWFAWARSRQKLARLGLNDDNPYVVANRELDEGWAPTSASTQSLNEGAPRIAAVLHLHYADVWPDFDACLRNIPEPFDLFVSLTHENASFSKDIEQSFPSAQVETVENRGRDILPFYDLLLRGKLDRYELVCKLHGKKSVDYDATDGVRGRRWRRRALLDLLGSPDQVSEIFEGFRSTPKLGIVGPSHMRIPNQWVGEKAAWSRDKRQAMALAAKMNPEQPLIIDYFAGTMFWARPQSLAPLKQLKLGSEDFPVESGQQDGTIHHALERLFIHAAKIAGHYATEASPYTATDTIKNTD